MASGAVPPGGAGFARVQNRCHTAAAGALRDVQARSSVRGEQLGAHVGAPIDMGVGCGKALMACCEKQ